MIYGKPYVPNNLDCFYISETIINFVEITESNAGICYIEIQDKGGVHYATKAIF